MSITWTRDQLCNDAAAKQPAETPDATLIQSIAAGEKRAMEVFYARHNVRVYRFLLRLVGDDPGVGDRLPHGAAERLRHQRLRVGRGRRGGFVS